MLDRFSGFQCNRVVIFETEQNTKLFLHVQFPRFEPFIVDNITNVFLFFFIVEVIPFIKMFDEFFLEFVFSKNVKKFPKFIDLKIILTSYHPFIN